MVTIAYITARPDPRLEWFFDSLALNDHKRVSQIVIVDKFAEACDDWTEQDVIRTKDGVIRAAGKFAGIVQHVAPKPCVWSGRHRLTPRNWWSASSYRNTALCYCKGSFIAYLDDRCVLMPTWMDVVNEAMQKQYAVCGVYSKQSGMVVSRGRISNLGQTTATDVRMDGVKEPHRRRTCPGDWMFGCTFALPTEWMLQVNGFDESWDSVSMEDTHFGKMLENNRFPIFHDGRMKMVEDRTPSESDPSGKDRAEFKNPNHDMKRSSKEKHPNDPNDKTHALIKKLWNNNRSAHPWDIRLIRDRNLGGYGFPIPQQPTCDWFDGQPLKEMV